jgi:hypothetical protein
MLRRSPHFRPMRRLPTRYNPGGGKRVAMTQESSRPDVPRLLEREQFVRLVATLFNADLVQLDSLEVCHDISGSPGAPAAVRAAAGSLGQLGRADPRQIEAIASVNTPTIAGITTPPAARAARRHRRRSRAA